MPQFPNFTGAPRQTLTAVATANTNRDGTGTVANCFTAGPHGSRVDKIRITASVTTTAGVIRIFFHNGSAFFLIKEVLVDAITPSTSIEVFTAEVSYADGLLLPAPNAATAASIRVSTHNAENFNVAIQGGDF